MHTASPARITVLKGVVLVALSLCNAVVDRGAAATEIATGPLLSQPATMKIQVQAPDGKPINNVIVVCIGQETNAVLKGNSIEGGGKRAVTGRDGYFDLEGGPNRALMVAGEVGFCLAQSRDLTTNHAVIVVQPWGRIEGIRTDHDRPLANRLLSLEIIGRGVDPLISNLIDLNDETTTDSRGHFVFEHVPPVEVWLQDEQVWRGSQAGRKPTPARLQEIDMSPGETKSIEVATHGRTVAGRIELDPKLAGVIDFKSLDESLARGLGPEGYDVRKRPWVPAEFDTSDKRAKWYLDWFDTEEGRQRKAAIARFRSVMIREDGSFLCEMVEPGNYVLDGNLRGNRRTVALLDNLHFVVPPLPASAEDVPVDAGRTTLRAVVQLKAGDPAPDFKVPTLDDSSIKLSEFRGRYVLLDFWATWCGPCVAETPNLKSVYEAFGNNQRFVMISLSSDSDREAPARFVKAKGVAWSQAFLGGEYAKDIVAQNYGITAIPQIMLIGPDGKIVARDLRGPKIREAVEEALGGGLHSIDLIYPVEPVR